jgi:hypothetical protein
MYPQPYEPPPKDPAEQRFEDLAARIAGLEQMTPKLPA